MIFIRSLLFNFFFFAWSLLASLIFIPLFVISPRAAQLTGHPWAAGVLWFARVFLGLKHEIRGRENLPPQAAIFASKHQSAWDTMIFLTLFPNPAYVLKRELLRIPFWGWYLWRMKMVAIDRSAGASGMKNLLRQSRAALAEGRPLVIFPEGTRTRPGDPSTYHPGVVAMYSQLDAPVVPVALNSGHYWGKNAFIKRPGTIVMEFLPVIPPGLDKKVFRARLEQTIETASQALAAEAKA